jgi:hypothetical protein
VSIFHQRFTARAPRFAFFCEAGLSAVPSHQFNHNSLPHQSRRQRQT